MDRDPATILADALGRASASLDIPIVDDRDILHRIDYVCRSSNRAGTRFLLSSLLAKLHQPHVDIRNPYTEIEGNRSYSGRHYDQTYIGGFVLQNELPTNPTTAYLTPAFRTTNQPLTLGIKLSGRPPLLYEHVLHLLDDVESGRVAPADLLAEMVRELLNLRNEQKVRLSLLLDNLRSSSGGVPLSAEGIVTLLQQHLASPKSSRLPVLMLAAAYKVVEEQLGERALRLNAHNAADLQTGSLGDLEIILVDDDRVVTAYEMKHKRVTRDDIDNAVTKVARAELPIQQYVFITTDVIDPIVADYAKTLYDRTGGIEFVVLDCIGFIRYFLHLFHRIRSEFLHAYQNLVLAEPDSAVSSALKESWLALRRAAQDVE